MENSALGRNKVEELSLYGKSLTGLEKEAVKEQEKIFMAEIKKIYGFFGRILFFIDVFLEQRRTKKDYPEAMPTPEIGGGRL